MSEVGWGRDHVSFIATTMATAALSRLQHWSLRCLRPCAKRCTTTTPPRCAPQPAPPLRDQGFTLAAPRGRPPHPPATTYLCTVVQRLCLTVRGWCAVLNRRYASPRHTRLAGTSQVRWHRGDFSISKEQHYLAAVIGCTLIVLGGSWSTDADGGDFV